MGCFHCWCNCYKRQCSTEDQDLEILALCRAEPFTYILPLDQSHPPLGLSLLICERRGWTEAPSNSKGLWFSKTLIITAIREGLFQIDCGGHCFLGLSQSSLLPFPLTSLWYFGTGWVTLPAVAYIRKWTAILFPGTGREECNFLYPLLLINDIHYTRIMITLVSSSHIYEYKSFALLQPQDESDLGKALGTL